MDAERLRQIAELYRRAAGQDVDRRRETLAHADPDIRREVELLLAQPHEAPPTPLSAGAMLGSYRIEAVIGAGGMGVVYRALDTRLNRPAAIKVLSDELADASARRRFQREAQLACFA